MNTKLQKPVAINGTGDSLWGNSKGKFSVSEYYINFIDYNEDGNEEPYELQLFGKNTEWRHYTDSQIVKEVNETIIPFLQKNVNPRIEKVCWSEQGMQPDAGWSFDIILAKK